MIIQPKIRGFICTTAHPAGCHQVVAEQIEYVKSQGKLKGPENVLIIGASTGYGLASRIVSTFGNDAKTIGVFYEKEADEKRTASAGWYNTAAFEEIAHRENRYAKSINGDAFSDEIKQQVADLIRKDLQKIDLIVYSLASPRRQHPKSGEVFSSVLKPIGRAYTSKTVDAFRGEVKDITLDQASEDEIANTIAVMGGEDWEMWIDFLAKENLLAEGVTTVAYSYVGPELTHPIYQDGTIGKAKEHLRLSAEKIDKKLKSHQGKALLSVNKAVVTQASAAIPVVPLYISLLFKLMKEKGTHEGCVEQIYRLYKDSLFTNNTEAYDAQGQIRLDDLEMQKDIQEKIAALWPQITSENLLELTDIEGYRNEFYRLFGFHAKGVDYDAEVDQNVKIPSIQSSLIV
ncbi:MAG: trans-2-enoyl-CoA reductase family protein [Gammaproteobacteria bacterium]|nr:trans-2-enoyl-CoA reductase family protein [Gammaproteobacteria bacterium]